MSPQFWAFVAVLNIVLALAFAWFTEGGERQAWLVCALTALCWACAESQRAL